jgi:MmyB-like transcription regulator ligand binding domain
MFSLCFPVNCCSGRRAERRVTRAANTATARVTDTVVTIPSGAIAGASSSVLDAIARALKLDDTERAHLFDLARAADGIPTSGRPGRRATRQSAARPSLHWALEAITDGVAFVRNQQHDLVATNALGRAFSSLVVGDCGRPPNPARFQFLYTAEPGSPSAGRLRLLASLAALTEQAVRDVAGLSDAELVGVLRASRRLVAREQYKQALAAAEFGRRRRAVRAATCLHRVPRVSLSGRDPWAGHDVGCKRDSLAAWLLAAFK